VKKFDFEERMPAKIATADAQRHLSSQGHPVDIYVRSKYMTSGVTTIPPRSRLGRIAAHGGDEVYFIAKGRCVVECPRHEAEYALEQGDVFLIPAGQIHAPRNDSDAEVAIFWVCAPDWP
jgi:mannose-6-phosphate isomerase-like protein (cupin superfamily)